MKDIRTQNEEKLSLKERMDEVNRIETRMYRLYRGITSIPATSARWRDMHEEFEELNRKYAAFIGHEFDFVAYEIAHGGAYPQGVLA